MSARRASGPLGASAKSLAIVKSPGFSIAPPKTGTTATSILAKGSGRSITVTAARRSGPSTSAAVAAAAPRPSGTRMRAGTGAPGTATSSNGPAAIATRYVGKGGVVSKRVADQPSPWRVREAGAVLLYTRTPSGARTVTVQGVFHRGSSKHGNARRASIGSKSL